MNKLINDTKDKEVEAVWYEFLKIMDDDEYFIFHNDFILQKDWKEFKKGTLMDEIFEWFNKNHSGGMDYLMPIDEYYDYEEDEEDE